MKTHLGLLQLLPLIVRIAMVMLALRCFRFIEIQAGTLNLPAQLRVVLLDFAHVLRDRAHLLSPMGPLLLLGLVLETFLKNLLLEPRSLLLALPSQPHFPMK